MQKFNIVWFRNDLRLADNPAVHAAALSGLPTIHLYILDDESDGCRRLGGAARWWLHGSLDQLQTSICSRGGTFLLSKGNSCDIIQRMADSGLIKAVFWNNRYAPADLAIDGKIRTLLTEREISLHSFDGALLNPPQAIKTQTGGPFKVFSPYWRAVLSKGNIRKPLSAPERFVSFELPERIASLHQDLSSLQLEPVKPDWAKIMRLEWQRGEDAAHQRLRDFMAATLSGYAKERDYPGPTSTSKLSPYLRFGEISPVQIFHAIEAARAVGNAPDIDIAKFINELIWREFAYHVLYHFPELVNKSWDSRFDGIVWDNHSEQISAWQKGETGFPIIDAAMRQLWQTGWMHNRARMIVGSFLVKHLLTDWRIGEAWFWDTLVDADQASNLFGWQWIAGCGFDAAPFHRIFNPVLQSQRFDPDGAYIRRYVPELAALPSSLIHAPWQAPASLLEHHGIVLGTTYPKPIIDLAAARKRALQTLSEA